MPNKYGVNPRYDQITMNLQDMHNRLQQIVSPDPDDEGVWIYQNAWFFLGTFDKDITVEYPVHLAGNGIYAFVIQGQFTIEETDLDLRDGLGITGTLTVSIKSNSQDSEILLMEVPMKF
jgi:redox-sensitive bicupin YhaK (pirin superfamily)